MHLVSDGGGLRHGCDDAWQLVVPGEDVDADERQHPAQRRQNLLLDVVLRVDAQARVVDDVMRLPHELNERQPRRAIHNDVRYSFPDARL